MKPSRFVLISLSVALSAGAANAAAQKPSASTCVALTVPSVQGVEGNATGFAVAVRDLFATYLKGPSIRTESVESRLASQAVLEAREKDCGQMLLIAVERKRSSGKAGRIFGQAAGVAVTHTPLGGGGVAGAVASGATSAGGEAIYRFASESRAKDELVLSYRLGAPDAVERAAPVSFNAKAKSDGEDLLTPLVEKAANAIVTTATAVGR